MFYCIHERAVQRRNVRERRRVREREHVKEGSWIADYVYEGIQETLGVWVKTLVQMFAHKILLYTGMLQPIIYINNI